MNKKKQNKIYSFYLFNKHAIRIKAVLPKKNKDLSSDQKLTKYKMFNYFFYT